MQVVDSVRDNGSRRVALSFADTRSRTKQSFKKDADINVIVSRYKKTGMLVSDLQMASRQAVFGDFTNAVDFHASMCRVRAVEQRFEQLPSALRKRFQHDAGLFLDFMMDPKNTKEAIKLGLLPKDRSAVRYVDRVTGKVTNILGQHIGNLKEDGSIEEINTSGTVAPVPEGAPAGDSLKVSKKDDSSAL